MNVLALEQSTPECSAAVLAGPRTTASRAWTETRNRNQQVFQVLPDLLAEAGLKPADIGLIAVGLGPGSFSGLRVILSAAQAFALPARIPVFGVASTRVTAFRFADRSQAIAVLGNARRERLWIAEYTIEKGYPVPRREPVAFPIADCPPLQPGTLVVSSDLDWLRTVLNHPSFKGASLLEEPAIPNAEALGRLTLAMQARGEPSLPLAPLYLHPPVATPHPIVPRV